MHKRPKAAPRWLLWLLVIVTLALTSTAFATTANTQGPLPDDRPADVPGPQIATGYTYIVQPGDDIWIIALAHDVPMEVLAEANGLSEPYWLQPGDPLWVPARPAPVSSELREAQVPTPTPLPTPTPQPTPVQANSEAPAVSAPGSGGPPDPSGLSAAGVSGSDGPAATLVALMNAQRVARGLVPLRWSPRLAAAAQAHADDLASRGWGGHVGSDGARLVTRVTRSGYEASWAGENWANARNEQHAFDMWWYEPPGADPHRRNILGSGYTEVGIGIAKAAWGYYFVADFGNR